MAKRVKSVHKPHVEYPMDGFTHGKQRPTGGVIHCTQSTPKNPADIYRFWRGQGLGYGAQLVISKSGKTAQGAYGTQIVWATYMHNTGKLQIELCGFAAYKRRKWLAPGPYGHRAQLIKLAKWIAWWNKHYGVPIRFDKNHGWARHLDFPEGGHTDPGHGFPLDWVLERARYYRRNGW